MSDLPKKGVSITEPAKDKGAPSPRRKLLHKDSLPNFTPDNYSSDEDDKFEHADAATPGGGWTNGQIPPLFTPAVTLHPYTRSGRLALYGHHRRWINFQSSWSRIGDGSSSLDAVHGESSKGDSVMEKCPVEEGKTVKALVAQLCERFYYQGWATGTGGGVSIRVGGPSEGRPYRVFVAPSGVQKEDMVGDDVFEMDMNQEVVEAPKTPNLKISACTPLWFVVYKHAKSAMCVIHTHSMNAQLATMLDPTEEATVLRVTHLEMLKGVGHHAFDDVLEVPIIDNRPTEDQLADQLEQAILKYPKCNAVLVRRHGIYAWGDSWEQAKAQCESFDYLFETAVKLKSMGIDCGVKPISGTYRVDESDVDMAEVETQKEPPVKKQKVTNGSSPAFNAAEAKENDADLLLTRTTIPLVPRDSNILLLDIEGTTSSISFVKEVLFPFVRNNLTDFISNLSNEQVATHLLAIKKDFTTLENDHPSVLACRDLDEKSTSAQQNLASRVLALMDHDLKKTGLKAFQSDMWDEGYKSGELVGHTYSDFKPMLDWCKSNKVRVCIYSSGAVHAQKLLFGHTEREGDLTAYLDAHFDTTSGNKHNSQSYVTIATALEAQPNQIIFVSDSEAEVKAAREAGMMAVVSVRPGNAPLSKDVKEQFPLVRSLLQICGGDDHISIVN
ncbi:hypothetical protein ACHAWX_004267 [Stephanocyclus meneghinianus]